VTAAVALLFAALLCWKLVAANPADAVLARARQAAAEERDRTYDVIDTWGEPGQSERTAVLQCRGEGLVFQALSSPWEGTWVGGDGRRSWMVPATGAVRTSDDPRAFLRLVRGGALPDRGGDLRLARQREALPFLSLVPLLEICARSYDLKLLPPEPVGEEGRPCRHVRGRRRGGVEGAPEGVEVWVRSDTGVVRRLVLRLGEGPGARRLTLELTGEEALPADWYEHAAHHDRGRPVLPWLPQRERGRPSP
jgi:hypothetical protein